MPSSPPCAPSCGSCAPCWVHPPSQQPSAQWMSYKHWGSCCLSGGWGATNCCWSRCSHHRQSTLVGLCSRWVRGRKGRRAGGKGDGECERTPRTEGTRELVRQNTSAKRSVPTHAVCLSKVSLTLHVFCPPLFVLQVLLQSHSHHHAYSVIHTSAVAAGGRYDALLRSLWSPAAATLMPAPGAGGWPLRSVVCFVLCAVCTLRVGPKGCNNAFQGRDAFDVLCAGCMRV